MEEYIKATEFIKNNILTFEQAMEIISSLHRKTPADVLIHCESLKSVMKEKYGNHPDFNKFAPTYRINLL